MPRIRERDYCATKVQADCMYNVKYLSLSSREFCLSACPSSCNTIVFNYATQEATYPNIHHLDLILDKATYNQIYNITTPFTDILNKYIGGRIINNESELYQMDSHYVASYRYVNFRENLLKVTVNYKDLTTTHFEDQPQMVFTDLLGEIMILQVVFFG